MKTNTDKKIIARFRLVDTKSLIGGGINPPKGIILEDNTVLWDNPTKAKVFLNTMPHSLEELYSSGATVSFVVE